MKDRSKRAVKSLESAIHAHQRGRFAEARTGYQAILRASPDNADALHFLGVLRHNVGDSNAGADLIRRSLRVAPANAHAWLNLGNILLEQELTSDARAAYEKVSQLAPQLSDGWYNLGICLRKMEEPTAAVSALDRAQQLRPDHAPTRYQRGIAHRDAGDLEAAEADFRAGLAIKADYVEIYESLGMMLYRQNRIAEAALVYAQWLEQDPQSSTAAHLKAAMSGDSVPSRGSDAYVRETFDRFAATFDQNLTNLGYRAPALVAERLAVLLAGSVGCVLDAGCGTGLCGPGLRPLASQLVGVDLSSAMVDLARTKGDYDELYVDELCGYMVARPCSFDAIVAADTLVYFGALEEALAAAAQTLRESGILVITLEELMQQAASGYRLEPHGRYSHRIEYIRSALVAAGFVSIDINHQILRRERGAEVNGLVVSARKCRAGR